MIKIIGFKLVEVMVTLVIAKTELARIAQLQEMFFIDNRANGRYWYCADSYELC